jgi:hypothetical protein
VTTSDTPETDAFITKQDYSPTGHQWRNFTRKLERERDQARNENLGWENKWKFAIEMAAKAEVERDEARNAVPDGEWVAHEDYQKVHEKASRLLVAINKQLPIGCFILINTEYHALANEIYWRNEVK